jgi:hypothetical protein
MMRINRNLAAALAITALLITGIVAWQISDADQATQVQPKAEQTASATPIPTASEEPSIVSEEPSLKLEDSNPKNLSASNIWTYNCEIPVQLPESFLLTCADGGWYVYNIKWQSWGEQEAKATAIFSEKVCEPSCADGYRVEAPVTLTLSTFANPGKKIYLTNLDMRASTEKNFENGNRTLTWDLGEFAKMMGEG